MNIVCKLFIDSICMCLSGSYDAKLALVHLTVMYWGGTSLLDRLAIKAIIAIMSREH